MMCPRKRIWKLSIDIEVQFTFLLNYVFLNNSDYFIIITESTYSDLGFFNELLVTRIFVTIVFSTEEHINFH
jgi:hypothetical protein